MRTKVILDCDPGMDDSIAIVLAAKAPSLQLLAVTTTHGNYPVAVTTPNALKTLEMIARADIPVARGAARPLVRTSPTDPFSHGADGQADNNLPAPTTAPDSRHAAQLIIDEVMTNPGEVHLIVTGPMTNLALAMTLEPRLKEALASVTAISGMFGLNRAAFLNATGDTPQSEWNVYVDPEAAKLVYESGVPLTAIGLDVATHFEVDFSPEQLSRLRSSGRAEARFLMQAIDFVGGRGYDAYCTIIDAMAVAALIDGSLLQTMTGHVGIETSSPLTLGMTVLDGRHHHVWQHLPVIKIATQADYASFLTLVVDLITK